MEWVKRAALVALALAMVAPAFAPATIDAGAADSWSDEIPEASEPIQIERPPVEPAPAAKANVIKTLYLHDDGAYDELDNWDFMNTILPLNPANQDYDNSGFVGTVIKRSTLANNYQEWNLTPVLANDLHIVGNVNLTLWTRCNVGAIQDKNMTFTLRNSTGPVIGKGYYNRSLWPTSFFKTNVTIPVGDYNVAAGDYIHLNISRTDTTGQFIYLMLDNDSCPSHLNLTTDTYVDVNWTKTFEGAVETYDFFVGQDARIVANVTDPFGSYDISGATVNVTGPGGATYVPTTPMSLLATDPSSPSGWKHFDYTFAGISAVGMYKVVVTGIESNNVTSNLTTFFNATSPGVADHLVYLSGDAQGGIVGQTLSQQILFRVVNASGVPLPGTTVNFTVDSWPAGATGQRFEESGSIWFEDVSNSTGVAGATLRLGSRPGVYALNVSGASLAGFPKYDDTRYATAGVGPAYSIAYVSGNSQTATVGTALSPYVAVVRDSFGNAVAGSRVWFNVTGKPAGATGESLSASSAVSNATGRVSAVITLGDLPGQYNVTFANLSLPGAEVVYYNSTATSGPSLPLRLALVSGGGTSEPVGTAAPKFVARVEDTGGTPVAGSKVNWAITSIPSGASGYSVTNATSLSAADGTVSTTLNIGSKPGWYNVTASNITFAGVPNTISFTTMATAGEPDSMELVSGDGQAAVAGDAIPAPLIVRIQDRYGNPVPGVVVNWGISSVPQGADGQSVSPQDFSTNETGHSSAFFTLGNAIGPYLINASSGLNLTGEPVNFTEIALSNAYDVTIVGGDGQSAPVGTVLTEALTVEVLDSGGSHVGAGVKVWFNVTTSGLAGDGAVNLSSPALTDPDGWASVRLLLDTLAGINSVTAEISSKGVKRVTFTETGTAPKITPSLDALTTTVPVGESVTYVLHADNLGNGVCHDVWINDTLPDGIEFVHDSSFADATVSGMDVTWFIEEIPPGSLSWTMTCTVLESVANATVLSNMFTVDYGDEIGRRFPREQSNTVNVTALSEATQNLPPDIVPIDDLYVHFEWDYSYDLSPYISDPDNTLDELALFISDNVNAKVSESNHLELLLNYSISLNGTVQELNVTVSDGEASDWEIVLVHVTDNFPPEIINQLPDWEQDEDSVGYPFNISEYFFDRDGDALFFTSKVDFIKVTILDSYIVEIRNNVTNWYGLERVTFRAYDESIGGRVEKTINVTIVSVNDLPAVQPIPDQSGKTGRAWALDLYPFVSDVDHQLTDLFVSTDHASVVANGLNLTFRFKEAVDMEIVTITVSDGIGQSFRQLNVTVKLSGAIDPICYVSAPIIVIALAALLALMVYRRRNRPDIENIFVIYKDGALLAHAMKKELPNFDKDIFTSMLTAITDFVKDSFQDGKEWTLDKLEFGGRKIFIARSATGHFSLAVVYLGGSVGLRKATDALIADIESSHGGLLTDWDGNLTKMSGIQTILTKVFEEK